MTTFGKEEVGVSQKKKNECNARAQKIVLELIDGVEFEKEFLEQLRWINQDHYQDIVEERAITKSCGYPICEQKLDIIPKKKYHINIIQNKVYDITDRKLFCSNRCYKASRYLKMQLHTNPLWLGNREEREDFSLLKCKTELTGEEISFDIQRVKLPQDSEEPGRGRTCKIEDNDVESCTYTLQENLEFCYEDESNHENSEFKDEVVESKQSSKIKNSNESLTTKLYSTNLLEIPTQPTHNFGIKIMTTNVQPSILRIHVDELSSESDRTPKSSKLVVKKLVEEATNSNLCESPKSNNIDMAKSKIPTPSVPDLVHHVEQCMREWMTIDSLRLILGEQAVTDWLQEKGRVFSSDDRVKSDPQLYDRYNALCKRLKIPELEQERESEESSVFEPPSKPLPDLEALRKQTEEIEIKVRAFYRGDRKVSFAETKKENNTPVAEDSKPNILPAIHLHAQNSIRRDIILNKLKLVLPDLCIMLGLNRVDISSMIKQLMYTCRFSAHNITFKPLEWNLIGLILLRLLSIEDRSIQTRLQDKSKYVNTILMSYNLETNYLDCLTTWLTVDLLELIVQNEIVS